VWPPKITKEMELLRYFKLGETGFMDEEKRKAMEFIRAHPGIFLELTWDRIVTFWTGLPAPVESFIHAETQLVRALLVCNALAGLGGLVGIVVLTLRRSPYAFPAAAYPVVFPWLYYITHPNLRYRHPIDPVVLLLAALAIGSLLGFRPATAGSSSGLEER
jgi:hypothetical protein